MKTLKMVDSGGMVVKALDVCFLLKNFDLCISARIDVQFVQQSSMIQTAEQGEAEQ